MNNKKKYIIAIVLFIFLGLMVFTFANPSDEENNKLDGNATEEKENTLDEENNENTENKENTTTGDNNTNNATNIQANNVVNNPAVIADNSYALALEAVVNAEDKIDEESYNNAKDLVDKVTNNVQKEELQERLDEVKDGIDAKALVAQLTNKVETSENKENMDDARDFRKDEKVVNKVNELTNEDLKEELQNQLATLALLLDDTTAPVVKDENGDQITNGKILAKTTSLLIEDDNNVVATITELESNESTELGEDYTAGEGTYTLTLTDEAFNEAVVTFTIDLSDPEFNVTSGRHSTESIDVVITDATFKYVEIYNQDAKTKVLSTNSEFTLEDEATYRITAYDEAGHSKVVWTAIDKTKPSISTTNGSVINYTKWTEVKDKFLMTVTITREAPDGIVTTETFTREDFTVGTNNENFTFRYKLKEEGKYTITAEDKAGHKYTETVTIDKTAPQPVSTTYSPRTLTNGGVTVTIRVSEELKPVDGWTLSEDKKAITRVFTENVNGNVTISDLAGNEVVRYYSIKNIDKEAPQPVSTTYSPRTLTNGDVTVTIRVSEELKPVDGWTLSEDKKAITRVFTENVNGNVTISDLAGNEVVRYYSIKNIDKEAPTAEVTMSNNNGLTSTNQNVTVTLKTNETINTPEGWKVVTEGTEFTKVYSENGWQTVVITDKAGNQTELKFEVKRIDKINPVLTIINPDKYQMEVYTEFVDPGYSVWDAVDKDVTNLVKKSYKFQAKGTDTWEEVDSLDTTKLGIYEITYTAYDKAGNTDTGSRQVEIVDKTAPVLVLNGEENVYVEAGEEYTELGVTVTDNYDEDRTSLKVEYINHYDLNGVYIGRVVSKVIDTKLEGKYLVVYQEKDSNGNISEKETRWVIVTDTTAPTVNANLDEDGNKDIRLEAGSEYKELGATVTDNADETKQIGTERPSYINLYKINADGSLGSFVRTLDETETIDTSVIGWYLVVYVSEDAAGNVSNKQILESKRWVIVQDTKKPIVFGINKDHTYASVNVTVKDATKVTATIDGVDYVLGTDYAVEGTHMLVVTDAAGNYTRVPFIIDSTPSNVENGVANLTDDIILVDQPFYNEVGVTEELTINGNGKTVTQKVTSGDKFQWIGGNRTTMGNLFTTDNGAKITVNNLNFAGTTQTISLGQHKNATYNNYNTELNNVNVIGLKVVSFSANISPAVVVYGTATLNNVNIYDTKLSELETDPMWPVYDLALVNYTTTTINGGKIGSIVTWNQLSLTLNNTKVDTILTATSNKDGIIVNDGTIVNLIDVEDVGDDYRKVPNAPIITINSGATVNTLDLRGAKDYSKVTIKDGATVNKIITDSKEMTLAEWLNEYK